MKIKSLLFSLLLFFTGYCCYSQVVVLPNATFADFCNGSTRDLSTALPPNPGRYYAWTTTSITNVKGNRTSASGQLSITETLSLITNNTTTGSIVYNILTSDNFQLRLTVTVLPTPFITNRPSAQLSTVCGSINSPALTAQIATNPSGWDWTRPAVLGTQPLSGSTNGISDNLIDTTPNQVTVKYAFTITASNGCLGYDTIAYTILPTPLITSVAKNDSICSGLSYRFTPTTSPANNAAGGAGVYYTWGNPNVTTGLSNFTGNPTTTTTNFVQTLTNNTSGIITTTYSITPSYRYSTTTCTGSSFQILLSVNPRPNVGVPVSTSSCSGTSFSYSPVDSLNAGVLPKNTILPANTVFTWGNPVYSDSSLSGGSGLINIPPPSSSSPYVSGPISQILTNKSAVTQNAKYTIYLSSTYGTVYCPALAPFDLKVDVKIVPDVIPGQDTFPVCSGSVVSFPVTNGITSYTWTAPQINPVNSLSGNTGSGSGPSFAPVLVNTKTVTAYAQYVVTPKSGSCSGKPLQVVLGIKPVVNISTQNIAACSGSKFVFNPAGVPDRTKYIWSNPSFASSFLSASGATTNLSSSGDSSISATINYSGIDSGSVASFIINSTTDNCPGQPFVFNALIRPLPSSNNATLNVCSQSTFTYTPASNLKGITTFYSWPMPGITPDSTSISGGSNATSVNSLVQTLNNSSKSIQQASYTITPTANGCSGSSFTVVASINPIPVFTNKDTTICSGYALTLNPSPLPSITSYTWEAPIFSIPNSITGGSAQTNAVTVISQVLTNTTNSVDVIASYKVTPSYNSCLGTPFKLTVTVKASPSISDSLRTVICSGNAFSVQMPTNIPVGTQYIWDQPTYIGGVSGGSANTVPQKTISQSLKNTNTDTASSFANYKVTPLSNGCLGPQFPVKVTIKTSSAVLTGATTLSAMCSGLNFTYSPQSNFPGTAFTWVRDSTAGISNPARDGFADINETLLNTTGQPVTVIYKYTLQYNGCANLKTQDISVVVKPKPVLLSTLQPPAICSGNTFNYVPASNTINTQFNWYRAYVAGVSEPLTTGNNSISENLHNTTLNQVQVPYVFSLAADGCTSQQTVYEIVNPVLTLNDQVYATCSGTNFQIVPPNTVNATFLWDTPIQSNGIIGGSANTAIASPKISGVLSNLTDTVSSATYIVTPFIPGASSGNCRGVPFNVKVVVNPIPVLSSPTSMPDLCSGDIFTYTPKSNTPGSIFSWSRDSIGNLLNPAANGTFGINEKLINTSTHPIKIYYKYKTSFSGCTDSSKTVSLTLNAAPVISDQQISICSGTAFSVSTDLEPTNTTYTWPAPQLIPNNSLHGFTSPTTGQTLVSDTLNNSAVTSATAVYTIYPKNNLCPLQPFLVKVNVKPVSLIGDQSASACNNKAVLFTPVGVPAGTLYKWVFNDPNPSYALYGYTNNDTAFAPGVLQTLNNSGTSPVIATYLIKPGTNGCTGKPFQLKFTVNPTPTVKVSGRSFVCKNDNDTIQLNFTGTAPWSYAYTDNISNTVIAVNGINQNPSYFVQANLRNSQKYIFSILHLNDAFCSNDTSAVIPVLASLTQGVQTLPADSIIVSSGNLICAGSSNAMYVNKQESFYQWFQNGSAIPGAGAINYNATSGGSYSVKVTDSLGCSNMSLNTVMLYDLKTFKLSFSVDNNFCINNPKVFFNNSDTSVIHNISWKWNFNGEDSSANYSALTSFKKAGTKRIRLTANIPGCVYSISLDSVFTFYQPAPGIKLPTVTTNSGTSLQLQARVFQGVPSQYIWQPNIGLSSNNISNPVFSYFRSQDYFIKLISPEGCVTQDTLKVRVFDSALTEVLVPKSFTPNGDGNNDVLYPYLAGMQKLNVFKIFNKYGKLVFETRDPSQGWDGNYSGVKQPMDVYVWYAEAVDKSGNVVHKNGSLLLIR